MTPDHFRAIALRLPEAAEGAHMGRADFRVAGKIFATLAPELDLGMAKLTMEQQELLCAAEPAIFTPVPGGWGRRGSTHIRLAAADAASLESAVVMAFRNVAPKRLVAQLGKKPAAGAERGSSAPPRSRLKIRRARRKEAQTMTEMIARTIAETNAGDYPPSAILALKANFSLPEVERRMRERLVYVALRDDRLVGTASLAGARVHSVFVDPSLQGEGIGAALMAFLESQARRKGYEALSLTSSLTAVNFYRKLGYEGAERITRPGGVETVLMMKALRR
jgi:GNAT superfamily N-acetyltransferase